MTKSILLIVQYNKCIQCVYYILIVVDDRAIENIQTCSQLINKSYIYTCVYNTPIDDDFGIY